MRDQMRRHNVRAITALALGRGIRSVLLVMGWLTGSITTFAQGSGEQLYQQQGYQRPD